MTAGDRGLAQALQYEKPARVATKPLSEINNVKPSESSPAGMKRPKRVLAGLRGLILSAENSKSAPRVCRSLCFVAPNFGIECEIYLLVQKVVLCL